MIHIFSSFTFPQRNVSNDWSAVNNCNGAFQQHIKSWVFIYVCISKVQGLMTDNSQLDEGRYPN